METEAGKILKEKRIPFRVIRLSDKGFSAGDVVKYAIDIINSEEVCKTMITKDGAGNFYAFLLKGCNKIDFKKIKHLFGFKVDIIARGNVESVIGTEPGAVCPITLSVPIFVDEKVFQLEKINFGSGNHRFGIEVLTKDLSKMFLFKIVDISK